MKELIRSCVFVCRLSSSTQETVLRKGGEREEETHQLCVYICVCTQAWLLTCGTSRDLMLPSAARVLKEGTSVWTGNSSHAGHCVNSRQRMPHFIYSWKKWCILLCHRELLLSAGVWCGEGETLREIAWPGIGPAAAMFEITVGIRSFIFTEKGGKLMGCCFLRKLMAWGNHHLHPPHSSTLSHPQEF